MGTGRCAHLGRGGGKGSETGRESRGPWKIGAGSLGNCFSGVQKSMSIGLNSEVSGHLGDRHGLKT